MAASLNTGDLSPCCPFDALGFGGRNDLDECLGWRVVSLVHGAFEGPVGHLAFGDTGIDAVPAWREQAFA
jgi:hypothetical protein